MKNGNETHESELDLPIWSVVSFDKLEASGLTYTTAYNLLEELESRKVAGLCLVTDEAASRFGQVATGFRAH
jgi:hypothetical protein